MSKQLLLLSTLTELLVLIIAGFLFYRQRQKANRIIACKNRQLQHFFTEKEWLLKELHHRVKNNLHMVISLLESQAVYLDDEALEANEQSQHRIYAMSLIHQKLYQVADVKTIDMQQYLAEFIHYLESSYRGRTSVRFELDIEPVFLDVSYSIPLALIINEAVTNSIKYAFPEKTMGTVSISMRREQNEITLVIADNGIGMTISPSDIEPSTLGMTLMQGLSEDIRAKISFASDDHGTKITLVFKELVLFENDHPLLRS